MARNNGLQKTHRLRLGVLKPPGNPKVAQQTKVQQEIGCCLSSNKENLSSEQAPTVLLYKQFIVWKR